jgi:putative membrane protein
MRYGYGEGGVGWGAWLAMAVMMVAFWGAIAWVIVTLVRNSASRSQPPAERGVDPLGILDERFARGEIDDEEYRRRREVLRSAR